MLKRSVVAFGLAVVGIAAWAAPARAEEPSLFAGSVQLSTGFDWSRGDYGSAPDTSLSYLPTTLAYRWERFPAHALHAG